MNKLLYFKFIIEFKTLLNKYKAEIYKSAANGNYQVEFNNDYEECYTIQKPNVLSVKNISESLNKNENAETIKNIESTEILTIIRYIARNKNGDLHVYHNKPYKNFFSKITGCWQGIREESSSYILPKYFPTVTWESEPEQITITISHI